MGREHVQRKSEFTEDQFAIALKQDEMEISFEQLCREMGVSDATFCAWRTNCVVVGPAALRLLRQLDEIHLIPLACYLMPLFNLRHSCCDPTT